MTEDIVTRLREGCSECGLHTLYACTHEAADEIERLRLEVRDLLNVIQRLKESDNG